MSERIAGLGYASAQGLGHLLRDFYHHKILDDVMIYRHRARKSHMEWYPPDTFELVQTPFNGPIVDKFVRRVKTMLFFETPFDWSFVNYCRERGVKTALMPMYEWFPENPPQRFDKMICPSLLDLDYFPEGVFIPVPVRTDLWKQRTTATRFLHNAGHVGFREHKGTVELLRAVQHVTSPFTLTVRSQDRRTLEGILKQVPSVMRDSRVRIEMTELPYEQLWDNHDVLIAPEKFNGLSLPLQEGYAAGMLVMTTDRYPMNTWLPKEPLIPVHHYEHNVRVAGPYKSFDEAVVAPEAIAATIDLWFGKDITEYSLRAREWSQQHSWEKLAPRYREELLS